MRKRYTVEGLYGPMTYRTSVLFNRHRIAPTLGDLRFYAANYLFWPLPEGWEEVAEKAYSSFGRGRGRAENPPNRQSLGECSRVLERFSKKPISVQRCVSLLISPKGRNR